MFTVKDRDLFGISNQYVAEGFIAMTEIAGVDANDQIHLALSRPQSIGIMRTAIAFSSIFVVKIQS